MQRALRDSGEIPIGIGYYTAAEAARLLKTKPRQISRWLGGYRYAGADGAVVRAPPLWRPQLPNLGEGFEIGFGDLIELRFVLAFLKQNVGLNVIRRCLESARAILGEERPFSTHRFRTDGKSLFLESLSQATAAGEAALLDLKTNQTVFKLVVEQTFRDLDMADGSVVQWRPHNGKSIHRETQFWLAPGSFQPTHPRSRHQSETGQIHRSEAV